MTQLSPLILKRLEGSQHTVANALLTFDRSSSHLPAAREGGEGYAVPVTRANRRFMLKSYFLPTEQRKRRTSFLSALALHQVLPTLAGAPECEIDAELTPTAHSSVSLRGYLAALVQGDTFEALLNEQFDPDIKARLHLARQLCGTVRVLEKNHLAHGDLAMSNVMLTDTDSAGRPNLKLIDFDGFYHPVVPTIPCSRGRGGRGFGQDGYRHRAYGAMDASVTVTSDRAAMAVLAFELVALHWTDLADLRRTTLLDQSDIDSGNPTTSETIIARWPEGWRLVRRALGARRPECAPSPAEWYQALTERYEPAVTPPPPVVDAHYPSVPLRILERGHPERRVKLRNAGNSFASVSSRLAWLAYERCDYRVRLCGSPPGGPVFLMRGGTPSKLALPLAHLLESGDELQWDDFVIEAG